MDCSAPLGTTACSQGRLICQCETWPACSPLGLHSSFPTIPMKDCLLPHSQADSMSLTAVRTTGDMTGKRQKHRQLISTSGVATGDKDGAGQPLALCLRGHLPSLLSFGLQFSLDQSSLLIINVQQGCGCPQVPQTSTMVTKRQVPGTAMGGGILFHCIYTKTLQRAAREGTPNSLAQDLGR